jgi:hypothetical protein
MDLTELLGFVPWSGNPTGRTPLFCEVDDFYRDYLQTFSNTFFPTLNTKLPQYCRLAPSEVMTIVIHFHQSSYRNFKHYYIKYVSQYLADYFPHLLSYSHLAPIRVYY